MNFKDHSNIRGKHAFLSPSNYHWVNYDDEKLRSVYTSSYAALRGERLHNLAKECIDLMIKLPKTRQTLNMFVNDAIGFRMASEQILYYSDNCFGTADAISFKRNVLRIHDLKTGVTPASMIQLYVYAAIFFLEYGVDPLKTRTILRIYQNNNIVEEEPDPKEIMEIMEIIIHFDDEIEKMKGEGLGG